MNHQPIKISKTPEEYLSTPFIIVPINLLSSFPGLAKFPHPGDRTYAEISYAAIRTIISQMKSGLKGKITTGERVGIYCTNPFHAILSILVTWEIGASPVVVNTKLPQNEIKDQLLLTECSSILCDTLVELKEVATIYNVLDLIHQNQCTDDHDSPENSGGIGVYIFTSGVTGASKAVEHSLQGLINAFRLGNTAFQYDAKDIWLLSLPLFHISGFSILVRALLSRAAIVVTESGNTETLTEALKKMPITLCSLVPTQLKRLTDGGVVPPKSLRYCLIGGGHSEVGLIEKSIEAGWKSVVVYGSSETSAFVTALLPHQNKNKNNCVGLPLEGILIHILAETGEQLAVGLEGEICISSPTLFRGYYNNEPETKAKLAGGFYRTGDYGHIDENGYLFVSGRKGDIINSGGEKVDPIEIERLLHILPYVEHCCVLGLPHPEWGEAVTGIVVLRNGAETSESEVLRALADLLPSYKLPKKIVFLNRIPLTDLGKINRKMLKALVAEQFPALYP